MIACLIWRSALFAFRDEIGFAGEFGRVVELLSRIIKKRNRRPSRKRRSVRLRAGSEDISQGIVSLNYRPIGPTMLEIRTDQWLARFQNVSQRQGPCAENHRPEEPLRERKFSHLPLKHF